MNRAEHYEGGELLLWEHPSYEKFPMFVLTGKEVLKCHKIRESVCSKFCFIIKMQSPVPDLWKSLYVGPLSYEDERLVPRPERFRA